MTDDVAEQSTPNMLYNGQLYSREHAAAELAKFDADKDRVAAALGGDVARQQERRDWWLLSRGHIPGATPAMPTDAAGVEGQVQEREQQIRDAVLDTWQKHITMDDQRRLEMKRGLATKQQMDEAKKSIARAKADPAFGAKVLAGDMDAKERWHAWHFVAFHCKEAPADFDWSKDNA
jgi:hypothetical protein